MNKLFALVLFVALVGAGYSSLGAPAVTKRVDSTQNSAQRRDVGSPIEILDTYTHANSAAAATAWLFREAAPPASTMPMASPPSATVTDESDPDCKKCRDGIEQCARYFANRDMQTYTATCKKDGYDACYQKYLQRCTQNCDRNQCS